MKVLVTGGAGYIGSHICLELLNAGHEVVVIDNLSNSCLISMERVKKLTGKDFKVYVADLCDKKSTLDILNDEKCDAVIHMAGLKAVGESVSKPLEYYENNLISTFSLLEAMKASGCKNIIFSSSATVYGMPEKCPVTEESPLSTLSPYGATKLFIERILTDFQHANPDFTVVALRYFNPIGAHESGEIGEDPAGIPNNLVPYVSQVAVGKLECLSVFGNDYPTPDGTCLRDYIHVVDLALGHIAALKKCGDPGFFVYNLGTGNGISVLDIVNTFEKVSGVKLNYRITGRRAGDAPAVYADASKAERELNFKTKFTLEDMLKSAWNWQRKNPNGYKEA